MDRTEIQTKVSALAAKLGLNPDIKYGPLPQDISNIEQEIYALSDTAYHYVYVEKGRERSRRTTSNIDELLYWIFWDATFGAARDYEMRHRRPREDFRRQLFEVQLEML